MSLGLKRELQLAKASGHDRRININDVIIKKLDDNEKEDNANTL